MTFTVDTREPWPHPYAPYFSDDVRLVRGTLETGDLCVAALPDAVVVERKAPGDLYGCLSQGRERFERELVRSRYLGRLVVVVDGSMSDLLTLAHNRGGGMREEAIIGTLAAWQRRYCPFFFAGSVHDSGQVHRTTAARSDQGRAARCQSHRQSGGGRRQPMKTPHTRLASNRSNSTQLKPVALPAPADADLGKTIAEQALCRLLAAPLPQTVQEFRQHTLLALLTGRQIEADFAEDASWQTAPPDRPGTWEMRCRESGFDPERVRIFYPEPTARLRPLGVLWVEDPLIGTNPLEHYHHNLTSIRWRFVAEP